MSTFDSIIGLNNNFKLEVTWSETVDQAHNSSTVTVTSAKVIKLANVRPFNSQCDAALTVNGTTFTYNGSYDLNNYSEFTAFSGKTVTVPHNADGTKSVTISFSFNGKLQQYYPNGSVSKTVTLTPIPQTPKQDNFTLSTYALTLGVDATVTVTSPQWPKHQISFVYGGRTDTSDMKTGASFATHPTVNFADIFPSTARTVNAKAILYSYKADGSLVGSIEKSVTLSIPVSDAYKPSFNAAFNRGVALGGDAAIHAAFIGSKYNVYFTNIMSLYAAVTNVSGKKNATITKAVLTLSGWAGNVTKTGAASEYTINSGVFTIEGQNRIPSVTVTDSRGLSTTKSGNAICVRPWSRPSVSVDPDTIVRGDTAISFGLDKTYMQHFVDPDGNTVNLAGESTLVTPTLRVFYKAAQNDSYTELSGVDISAESVTISGVSAQRAYDIRIILTDYIGDSVTYDFTVSSAQIDMHMRNAHIRFGGYINAEGNPLKEDPCFDCDWNAFFAEGVYIKDAQGNWHNIIDGLRGLIS